MATRKKAPPSTVRSYKLPLDAMAAIAAACDATGLAPTDVVRRSVRYFAHSVISDRNVAMCDAALRPFEAPNE
jgi:hypothetical protein